jgi:hypothetical protein
VKAHIAGQSKPWETKTEYIVSLEGWVYEVKAIKKQ